MKQTYLPLVLPLVEFHLKALSSTPIFPLFLPVWPERRGKEPSLQTHVSRSLQSHCSLRVT